MSRESALVTADWVEEHLDDPNVVLIEVDEDTEAYVGGHIRGAIRLDWNKDLKDGVRHDFISKERLEELFSAKGVANDQTIVLYERGIGWYGRQVGADAQALQAVVLVHEIAHWAAHVLPHLEVPLWPLVLAKLMTVLLQFSVTLICEEISIESCSVTVAVSVSVHRPDRSVAMAMYTPEPTPTGFTGTPERSVHEMVAGWFAAARGVLPTAVVPPAGGAVLAGPERFGRLEAWLTGARGRC